MVHELTTRLTNRNAVAVSYAVLDLLDASSRTLDLDGKIAAHRIRKLCADIIKRKQGANRHVR